jgi:hypothetical protein
MPRLFIDRKIDNRLICTPGDEFYNFGNEINNILYFIIFINCVSFILSIIKFFNKRVIEYREDEHKTIVNLNHII